MVTAEDFEHQIDEVITQQRLKKRVDEADSVRHLLVTITKILGFSLQYRRIPKSGDKAMILEAIDGEARG